MTPKEQYEARQAERRKIKDLDFQARQATETLMMMDFVDRFVTATERIADALDRAGRGVDAHRTNGLGK